ncbi:MAG: DUF3466 family protein [Planctomycetota bacterium]
MRDSAFLVGLLGLASAALTSGSPAHGDVLYTIADLTPDGYTSSIAFDVNASGDAVGLASRFVGGSPEEAYFVYDRGTQTSTVFGVGSIIPRSSIVGTGFRDAAINDDGIVVGSARFVGGASETRGFTYDGAAITSLGTFFQGPGTGSNIRPDSDAMDINATGVVAGNASSGRATSDNRDLYTATAAPINDFDGDLTAATARDVGRAINNLGQVAGSNQDAKATLFSAGGAETVLLADTGFASEGSSATDLNELGQVTVNANTSNTALVYSSATESITTIPQIGTGGRMKANGINESGDVVGVGDRDGGLSGQARGFFYDASEDTSVILEDRIVDKSVPAIDGLGDWERLRDAWAVNDSGWIVGEGERRFDGETFPNPRAYLLIPQDFTTGDYNASGLVEQGDLNLVLTNWGSDTASVGVPSGWINDLPVGIIDQAELNKVLTNWGDASTSPLIGLAIPEPAGLAAAAMGLLGLARRGRNRG